MTLKRRSSTCSGRAMSRSRIRTFVETRPPASRSLVAPAHKDVERTATPAGTHSGGQREPEATKKEHPQHLGVKARVEGRWLEPKWLLHLSLVQHPRPTEQTCSDTTHLLVSKLGGLDKSHGFRAHWAWPSIQPLMFRMMLEHFGSSPAVC